MWGKSYDKMSKDKLDEALKKIRAKRSKSKSREKRQKLADEEDKIFNIYKKKKWSTPSLSIHTVSLRL